jgi:hypothetical protein
MEVYQWLFRQNGFNVSSTGYFVYCNGKADNDAFKAKLEFDIKLLPYTGDDGWVDSTVKAAHKVLCSDKTPAISEGCDYCAYYKARVESNE